MAGGPPGAAAAGAEDLQPEIPNAKMPVRTKAVCRSFKILDKLLLPADTESFVMTMNVIVQNFSGIRRRETKWPKRQPFR
jgi:hypothetical protein